MSSTPSRWPDRPVVSVGNHTVNSPAADALRCRIQNGLPYGSQETIVQRSGASLRCVKAQIQGEDPLTVKVAIEALRLLEPTAADVALDELLAPSGRTVIRRPDEVRDAAGLLGANGALLAALAAAEHELGAGLSDGVLDTAEAVRLTAALTETKLRIDALLARVGGVR